MTLEELKKANKLRRDINSLKLTYDNKACVDISIINEVIEILGDDFHELVRTKYEELKKKFEEL